MHSGYDVKKKKRDEEKDQNAAGVKVDAALADDEGKNSSGNAQGTGDGQNLAAVGELADAGQEETGNPAVDYVYIIEYSSRICQQAKVIFQNARNGRILIFCGCFSHVTESGMRYNGTVKYPWKLAVHGS